MTSGLVGVLANDSARYSLFSSCIDQLTLPAGWKKQWKIGGDWCGARNSLCQQVLDEGHSHLWFMDDDHAFPASMLERLVAHDKPLVTPICLTRVYPFQPVQYTEKLDGQYQYLPIPLSDSPTEGLVEIEAGGCAGMLIRRDVIEAISPPWFEYTDRSEDIVFSEKVKAAGFPIYADLSVRLGHITTAVVWPAVVDGQWKTGLDVGRDLRLTVETAEVEAAKPNPIWTWKLASEDQQHMLVELQRRGGEPVNWQPNGIPEGMLGGVWQWFVDEHDGNGPHPVGDPFTYTLTEAK